MRTSFIMAILVVTSASFFAAGDVWAAGSLSVSTTPVALGTYDVFSVTDNIAGQGSVTVSYVAGTNPNPPISYTITISGSPNNGMSINPRVMTISSTDPNKLNYNVYTDAARTVIWNSVITGGADTITGSIKKNDPPNIIPVYGKITALQDVGVGNYSDQLTVTITY